ncbi:MAG: TIGR03757 family integrating conjugative element protein [gamma proteobacterium symbiont of Ctena orbiculata]|nr:MAG: TIGR03757 family integrating conjugative element protein [gamma proteobacterium symbiont of Ctena orbiculata]
MKVIGKTKSIQFVVLVLVVLALFAGGVAQAAQNSAGNPSLVEVFTTSNSPITRDTDLSRVSSDTIDIQFYELDGIQRIEAKLSKGLTADLEQSKRVVQQRFQQLRQEDRTRMQHAAMGLAKAMQYGADRYPAIVFDGQAVVYGVTDVQSALVYYRAWWREGKR